MLTFAIETSCDETGVAVVESTGVFEHRILVNYLASQIKAHSKFGGVVPGLAAREHVRNLPLLARKALKEVPLSSLTDIAYTDKPGLEPALLIGRTFAKTMGYASGISIYPINHLYGHVFVNFVNSSYKLKAKNYKLFPAIALVISGGHTQLYKLNSFTSFELLGETVDDAVGEALDKGARLLGLAYPGGPKIEALAKKGRHGVFSFPSPLLKSPDFRFSFSGLKTALLYKVRDLQKSKKISAQTKANLAFAYQEAAFTVIREKTKHALAQYNARTLLIGGGVAANTTLQNYLRDDLEKEFPGTAILVPEKQFCTDNAVMIALAHAIPFFANKD